MRRPSHLLPAFASLGFWWLGKERYVCLFGGVCFQILWGSGHGSSSHPFRSVFISSQSGMCMYWDFKGSISRTPEAEGRRGRTHSHDVISTNDIVGKSAFLGGGKTILTNHVTVQGPCGCRTHTYFVFQCVGLTSVQIVTSTLLHHD